MPEKKNKNIFYILLLTAFLMVAVYEFLTPNMSDDIIYGDAVAKAGNFFDLFEQEYEHYMNHSGRNVAHFILRVFLFMKTKSVFNVVAAAVFTCLSLLMYENIECKRKYDIRLFGLVLLFLWFLDPAMSNTVFWETGACNYLFTGTIAIAYCTYFRRHMRLESKNSISLMIKMFVLGLLAGWCNENTSGGVILFGLILFVDKWLKNNKKCGFIKPWMIAGFIGNFVGFAVMILSPGNFGRAEVAEEEHTGLLALMARFLKIVINIRDNYFILVAAFVVLLIFIYYMSADKKKFLETTKYMRMLAFVALMTAFSLIAVPSSQLRTYYGAGLFMMMAVLNGAGIVANTIFMSGSASDRKGGMSHTMLQTAVSSLVAVWGIVLAFTYIEQGANLARIKREFDERDAYVWQQVETGEIDVYAPMLRPNWENRFSFAYESDLSDDYKNWINVFYAEHYGIDAIWGVDREEWTAY
ncbi:hypothetical protein SAMN04487928_10159 [Butyrivibrio proteoclasticus]|uniref:Glycosyltransferase RgtA/B/C/D-like domain-containing protein n=1 Tax=Butyrivibrio proteoclasticus TaxID=43305 RepID=A0A1I5PLX2_9FIRM|nr:DUF6056 family protein [Butyrivibrio proteoclasticus]SFP35035.1 hypothetical protein SAMN04487928_10159 [Butyrivibrio proteoclasticus]